MADTDEDTDEETINEYRHKRRSYINWWIVLFFIAFGLVNFLLFLFMRWNENRGIENLNVIHMRMTFNEARNYCKTNNKQLLITKTNEEEDKLVERLRMKTEHWGNCTLFLLGFRAIKQQRYIDPSNGEPRLSLDLSFQASIPSKNQTCIRVNQDFTTTEFRCDRVKSQCWLCNFKNAENKPCQSDKYSNMCYGIISFTTERDYKTGIKKCRNNFKAEIAGLMLIPKKLLPRIIEFFKTFKYPPCGFFYGYGINMETNMSYVNPEDNLPMAYKSDRFLLTESNYECLAVDKNNDFKVVSESCTKPVCVLCA